MNIIANILNVCSLTSVAPNTSHFTTASQQTYMIGTFIALTYKMRKPRQREVKYFVPGHSSQGAAKQERPSNRAPDTWLLVPYSLLQSCPRKMRSQLYM